MRSTWGIKTHVIFLIKILYKCVLNLWKGEKLQLLTFEMTQFPNPSKQKATSRTSLMWWRQENNRSGLPSSFWTKIQLPSFFQYWQMGLSKTISITFCWQFNYLQQFCNIIADSFSQWKFRIIFYKWNT